jgi:hypothetical protein
VKVVGAFAGIGAALLPLFKNGLLSGGLATTWATDWYSGDEEITIGDSACGLTGEESTAAEVAISGIGWKDRAMRNAH